MAIKPKLTAIADAIRAKTGTTDLMTIDQMPEKIEGISGGTDTLGALLKNTLTSYTFTNQNTQIKDYLFYQNTALTSLDGLDKITSIGNSSFAQCLALEIDGDELQYCQTIGNSAFAEDTKIKFTTLPSVLTSLGSNAFKLNGASTNDQFTISSLPSGLTKINSSAFENRTKMTLSVIPEGITAIDSNAFSGCTSITVSTLPSTCTTLGGAAFQHCKGLTSFTIPATCTKIGGISAFYGCSGLQSVVIKTALTSSSNKLPNYTFRNCVALTSVTFEQDIKIGDEAFRGCNLASLDATHLTELGKSSFFNAFGPGMTELVIPPSVTKLGSMTFGGDASRTQPITRIVLNGTFSSVSNMGSRAFDGQVNVTEFVFNDSYTLLPSYICFGMTSLTQVDLPSALTQIPSYAFGSSGLTSIHIPAACTAINSFAFEYCTGLTDIYVHRPYSPSPTSLVGNALTGVPTSTLTIHVPAGSEDGYKNEDGWRAFSTHIVGDL